MADNNTPENETPEATPEHIAMLQEAVDLDYSMPSAATAAAGLGVTPSTFKALLKEAKELNLTHSPGLHQFSILHEDPSKQTYEASAADVIADLRRVQEQNPERYISRNYYRAVGRYAESVWTRYYGTFNEFRAQAGIVTSRHVKKMERDIAKHASVSNYRHLTQLKGDYEGKFLKPSNSLIKTLVACSDLHDKRCDPFMRRVFIDHVRRVQPDVICLAGDIFDLYEFGKYTQDPRECDIMGSIQWVHAFLADLRDVAPSSEIWFIEGNHEFRLLRHLSEATPFMKIILSELHDMTIPQLLGLDRFEVNFVAKADLGTFKESDITKEISRNWHVFWDSICVDHFPNGKKRGMPGFNGHHHKHICTPQHNLMFGAYEWHQLGGGHIRNASYCDAESWTNGFLTAHVNTDSKQTIFDYTDVRDFACAGGKFYERAPEEYVALTNFA